MKNVPSALLVDNLKHIHDHGLAVEFTAPKLVSLLTYLRGKQGVTELKAGQSTLKVTTLGNVTKTEAFWSHGSYHRASLHYYEAATGLKYTLNRDNGADNENAYYTLNSIIFGGELPGIWKISFGAQADKLRDWLKKWAMTITGSNGLRALAISARLAQLNETRRNASNIHASAEAHHLKYVNDATPEFFRTKHGEARAKLAATLAKIETRTEEIRKGQAEMANQETGEALWNGNWEYSLGLSRSYEGVTFFPATASQYSHTVQSANYSATVDATGAVSLSSGIRCEFTANQVLAWLKGETQAPHSSRYGTLQRLEASTRDGAALVLLKCGCHYVDATNVSAEFAQLLKPSHTVSLTPGKPRADFGTPEFAERLRERFAERLAEQETQRANAIREFADRRAYLEKEEANLPETIAGLKVKMETAKAALDQADKALETARNVSPLGADSDTLANLSRLILSSQSFHPSL
jgi:flagellar motility protein MotE (MotC chaperone)